MTFAKAAKQELRNTFGPQWASKAAMLAAVGFAFAVFAVAGMGTLGLADAVAADLAGMAQ